MRLGLRTLSAVPNGRMAKRRKNRNQKEQNQDEDESSARPVHPVLPSPDPEQRRIEQGASTDDSGPPSLNDQETQDQVYTWQEVVRQMQALTIMAKARQESPSHSPPENTHQLLKSSHRPPEPQQSAREEVFDHGGDGEEKSGPTEVAAVDEADLPPVDDRSNNNKESCEEEFVLDDSWVDIFKEHGEGSPERATSTTADTLDNSTHPEASNETSAETAEARQGSADEDVAGSASGKKKKSSCHIQ
jgi:hypothetical protein